MIRIHFMTEKELHDASNLLNQYDIQYSYNSRSIFIRLGSNYGESKVSYLEI